MNLKTKEIAEFDGWKPVHGNVEHGGKWIKFTEHTPPYLTDLNALHRVALDVMDRIDAIKHIEYSYTYTQAILKSFRSRPINGEYTDLHDAVYDAIVYLKQHDLCQPK